MQRRFRRHYRLFPLLLFLFLFAACGDLEGSGGAPDPEENISDDSAAPAGDLGVSSAFGGPYLSDAGEAITSPDDERVLSVQPGGEFYVQVDYEDPSGITAIEVNVVNSNPEGVAGALDPTQGFFTLGQPTGVSEPSGCDLSSNPTSVTCVYEIQVADDAVNIAELEGSAGEFAYVFRTKVTDAAGNTSDEAERGYVTVAGEGDGNGGDGNDGDGFIRVTTTSGAASLDGECTLRAAITAANTDTAVGGCPAGEGADTVILAEGATYTLTEVDNETEGASGLPSVVSEITLQGNGATIERLRQEGTPVFRLLYVAEAGDLGVNEVTLQGGTFDPSEENSDFRGGGVLNAGTLSVSASTLQENGTDTGVGALYNLGTATLEDSLITKNAGFPAGVFNDTGATLTIDNTRITDQNDEAYGMENKGQLVMKGGELSNNSDSSCCSAFTNYEGGSATFDGTLITGNGGQGEVFINSGELTFTNVTYEFNLTGIRNSEAATFTVRGSTIRGNGRYGIENRGTLLLTNSTVSGNGNFEGGVGITNSGVAEITRSTVQGNGVNDEDPDFDLQGVGITNEKAGTLTLTESTVSDNGGGGVVSSGTADITKSLIYNNGADDLDSDGGDGDGITNQGAMTLTNSTVTNNSGIGIRNLTNGTLEIAYSTIAFNGGTFYIGISNDAAPEAVTFFGTIIAEDFSCTRPITSKGYNITSSEPGDCGILQDTDITGTDGGLTPPADNGGPTLTRALQEDSPALDKIPADVCKVETDQRGVSRPQGEACDIGAFEVEQ